MNRSIISAFAFALSLAVVTGCASETTEPEQDSKEPAPVVDEKSVELQSPPHHCIPVVMPNCGGGTVATCDKDIWGCRVACGCY